MRYLAPRYFQKFKCIADKCTHSCCVGWEIDVDSDTLLRYQALEGEMGEWLRQSLCYAEDGAHFALDGQERCPHLRADGLCRIIAELGEGHLCEICREHPRFYHTVAGDTECGLGACCEEAARLILEEADYATLCAVKEDAAPAAPEEREFDLRAARAAVLGMLGDTQKEYVARLAAIRKAYGLPDGPDADTYRALFATLEYLDEGHRALLCTLDPHHLPQGKTATPCERFCAYLIYRHTGNAQDLQEFRSGVAYALLLQHLLGALIAQHGYSPVRAAVLLSEELEYSEENESAIRFALELQMK